MDLAEISRVFIGFIPWKCSGVTVMAILIVLTGCRCVCPRAIQECLLLSLQPQSLLSNGACLPFFGSYICIKKRVLKISIIKTPVPKNSIKNFIWNKTLQILDESLRDGTTGILHCCQLVLHCLLTGYSPSPIPPPIAVFRSGI